MENIYEHDCNECVFLGTHKDKETGVIYDLYVHPRETIQETDLVARYGDFGPDCLSVTVGTFFQNNGVFHNSFPEILKRLIDSGISIPVREENYGVD